MVVQGRTKDVVLEEHISVQSNQDEEEKRVPEYYFGCGPHQPVGDHRRVRRWKFWDGVQGWSMHSQMLLGMMHFN